jgi:hypothetical protein
MAAILMEETGNPRRLIVERQVKKKGWRERRKEKE